MNNRIRKITPDRRVTTIVGDGAFRHTVGRCPGSRTAGPAAVAPDSWGNLYFTDQVRTQLHTRTQFPFSSRADVVLQTQRVTKVADEKSSYTLAGSGLISYGDGFGEYAHFNYPSGICVDHVGVVYVAEFGGNRIRMIESNGFVRTLAGCGRPGDADGTGAAAAFNRPANLCAGPGYLLVADQFNHKIKRVTTLHTVPIPVPEAEPDTDVDSVNSLEDWYKVYRADNMSFDSDDD